MPQRYTRGAAIAAAAMLACSAGSAFGQECYADCDGSGELDFFDFLCYQNLFSAGDPEADCDGSGELDFFDFLCFQDEFAAGCPTGDVAGAELAGIPLGDYPDVDYVQAFDRTEPVTIAIDPTRHDVTGEVDVYIVVAKNAGEWAADPSLTDARPLGGHQVINFPGGSTLANRFELTNSAFLDSNAGERLGVGYDLVVDVNRNGMLDGGDLIDGLGDETGFYKFKNVTTLGPVPTTRVNTYTATFTGIPATHDEQRLTYPSDIASRSNVPVVIISHGNGQQYIWYDYMHDLFASHGWVVMSHQNNTGPGIEACSETQLRHTDYFFGNLATIAGGALDGKLDKSKTIWIGHSRGGEGVARAIDKIFDGTYNPVNYSLDDIILGSSIAPTDFLQTASANPHDVYYHLIAGSADGDVSGGASTPVTQYWALYERAAQKRVSTYIHGADHNDFNCCGFDDCSGPICIGRPEAQQAAKVAWHVLIQDAVYGNPAALEYVQRQQENSKPEGILASTIIDHEYKYFDGKFIIDSFQTQPATGTSSSGGAVTFDVTNFLEDRLDDNNSSFSWTPTDPMNGMTRGDNPSDTTRGVVFDYQSDRFLEFEVVAGGRNFTDFRYLSWRACQGTQHPDTLAFLGQQVYEVTLRDGAGATSTIRIDAYGAGHQQPFARAGGWANEFETIRVNTGDFCRDGGNGIDLTNIVAVRFEFGPSHGTARGRMGFDDVELTSD
jgi:hypothetical protein